MSFIKEAKNSENIRFHFNSAYVNHTLDVGHIHWRTEQVLTDPMLLNGIALEFAPMQNLLSFTEFTAETYTNERFNNNPLRVTQYFRFLLGNMSKWALDIGIDIGVSNVTPTWVSVLGFSYQSGSFSLSDRDNDKIPDKYDDCPDRPEDYNGFEDKDGCPDAEIYTPPIASNEAMIYLKEGISNEEQGNYNIALEKYQIAMKIAKDDSLIEEAHQCYANLISKMKAEEKADKDNDGIVDIQDNCPEEAEDIDNWEDEDGCPDLDNDNDGILDVVDLCPNEAENYNKYIDDDGCPDELDINALTGDIVYFDTNSSIIKEEFYPILEHIADFITEHPDLIFQIQAYADTRGTIYHNRDLSRERAQAVKDYLISLEVPETQLTIIGLSETNSFTLDSTPKEQKENRCALVQILLSEIPSEHNPCSIHVSSWQDITKAETEWKQLIDRNYDAYIVPTKLENKESWYRVFVGNYNNKKSSKPLLVQIQNLQGVTSAQTLTLPYGILINTYDDKEKALEEKIRLSSDGYYPYIIWENNFYYVFVGAYKSISEAQPLLKSLEQNNLKHYSIVLR